MDAERLDILTDGQLKKILDSKWAKYAKSRFRQRFWCVRVPLDSLYALCSKS